MVAAFLQANLSACVRANDTNFSQRPGFAEYFTANPPSESLPDAADSALLHRYRPHLYIARGIEPPIRFYEDYIAQGRLLAQGGEPLTSAVTPEILNRHRDDPYALF